MNQAECMNADWKQIGFEDALIGRPMSRIGDHRSACAQHNIVPDQEQYKVGFDDGLERFCLPVTAYEFGKQGKTYNNQCPTASHQAFITYYNQGREYYDLKNTISRYGTQISSANRKIERLEKDIAKKESRIISDNSNADERLKLLRKIQDYKEEVGQLKTEITEHERSRAVNQNKLSLLQPPKF
ncbi:DUF2799 domain-containing protein [Endozoicomonas montiporae]|nr:DUF2799 domain-containing protein [Endozoicomonas montiporae]